MDGAREDTSSCATSTAAAAASPTAAAPDTAAAAAPVGLGAAPDTETALAVPPTAATETGQSPPEEIEEMTPSHADSDKPDAVAAAVAATAASAADPAGVAAAPDTEMALAEPPNAATETGQSPPEDRQVWTPSHADSDKADAVAAAATAVSALEGSDADSNKIDAVVAAGASAAAAAPAVSAPEGSDADIDKTNSVFASDAAAAAASAAVWAPEGAVPVFLPADLPGQDTSGVDAISGVDVVVERGQGDGSSTGLVTPGVTAVEGTGDRAGEGGAVVPAGSAEVKVVGVVEAPAGEDKREGAVASAEEAPHPWGPCVCGRGSDGAHKTVVVEARTWPGINKPGGTGRITKRTIVVENICGEDVPMAFYDVRYLLGGSEKKVKETYVACATTEEGESRQSCPLERFTVPVSEPRRRRTAPKTSPSSGRRSTSSSPLGFSSALNRSSSKPAAAAASGGGVGTKRKKEKQGARIKATPSTVGKVTVPSTVPSRRPTGGGERSRKRSAPSDGSSARPKAKKASKDSHSKENQEERPMYTTKDLSGIMDLSEPQVASKTSIPLGEGRMQTFEASLYSLFNKNNTDKMSLPAVKAGVNGLLPAGVAVYDDKELGLALTYLEEEENKVMLSEGDLYRI